MKKLMILIEKNEYTDRVQRLINDLVQKGMTAEAHSEEWLATQEVGKECLFLTDSPNVCRQVVAAGGLVVAFLHERNRDEDFSQVQYAVESLENLDAQYFMRIYKRLTGQPWKILETKRCVLRETVEEDVEAFYAMYQEPSVTRYTEPLYEDKEKERQYIRDYRNYVYRFYEFGIWTVTEKETGTVIGRAGINMREGFETPEIGFVIGVPWQGQGIAFEICTAISDYARNELHMNALQALVQPENSASVRLCEKLGFHREGRIQIGGIEYIYFLRDLTG